VTVAYRSPETVVAHPTWAYGLMWVGFPVLGAGAGWLLALLLDRAVTWSWLPLPDVVRMLGRAPDLAVLAGAVVLGVLAGLVLAATGAEESLAVAVSDDAVVVVRGDSLGRPRGGAPPSPDGGAPRAGRGVAVSRFARGSVGAAFLDGGRLVLLDRDGAELAREPSDLNADRLAAAFRAHGYPWRADGDPHAARFRRWVPGLPDLPEGADALLRARARALEKGDRGDARELREELSRLGVVVREESKRQYYRVVGG
jgi:hypothetical protein